MPFTVRVSSPNGVVSFSRDSLERAAEKAIELQRAGMKNVSIRDAYGEPVPEAERLLVKEGARSSRT